MGLFDLFAGNKQYLIDWQNTVCDDRSNRLYVTKQQLITITLQQTESTIKAFDDCSHLLNNTVKPDVFFPRLEMAENRLAKLVSMEPFFREVKQITVKQSPKHLMEEFQKNKEHYVCDFIYRYYWSVKEKAEKMKTEKGKQNQYLKFYESLAPYFDQISDHNMKYIEAMCQQRI